MMPKWLYVVNHWLMVVSLIALIAIILLEFLTMPFWETMPDKAFGIITGIFTWGWPVLLPLFIVSSGVVVSGFAEHRFNRKGDSV